jgi:protein-disulfide isomerase
MLPRHLRFYLVAAASVWSGISCTGPAGRSDLVRLTTRVDSLAGAVAALQAVLKSSGLAALPETVTVSTAGAAALGSDSAPVTIVEFTDYQCPFCARHARSTLPDLVREFVDAGTVRYVIRDLPLPIHPVAARAAQAARCAGDQGADQYWRYHAALFEAHQQLAESSFVGIARKLSLDIPRFQACVSSSAVAAKVRSDAAAAGQAGLRGTPSFVIGRAAHDEVRGAVVAGAYPLARFREVIQGALHRPSDVASAKP